MTIASAALRPRLAAIVFVLSAFVAGCDDLFAPNRIEGVYALEKVGDSPVPYEDTSYRHMFLFAPMKFVTVADTIELRSDGTGEQRSVYYQQLLDEPTGDTSRVSVPLRHYRIDGTLHLFFDFCAPGCGTYREEVRAADGTSFLMGPLESSRRYRRVDAAGSP
jgi:hypothetical protein